MVREKVLVTPSLLPPSPSLSRLSEVCRNMDVCRLASDSTKSLANDVQAKVLNSACTDVEVLSILSSMMSW